MKIKILLMPLSKGELIRYENTKYNYYSYTDNDYDISTKIDIDVDSNDDTEINELIELVITHDRITPFLSHLKDIRKTISIHSCRSSYSVHGPLNLCKYTHEYESNNKFVQTKDKYKSVYELKDHFDYNSRKFTT